MKMSFYIGAAALGIILLGGIIYIQWQVLIRANEKVDNEFEINVSKASYEVGFKYEQNTNLEKADLILLDSLFRIGERSLRNIFYSSDKQENSINLELLDSLTVEVFSQANFDPPVLFHVYTMNSELIYTNADTADIIMEDPIYFQFSHGGLFPKAFMYAVSIPNSGLIKKREFRHEVWWSYLVSGAILITVLLSLLTLLKQNRLSVLKTEFVASMTHEIKTPLATLNLAIDTLQNREFHNDSDAVIVFTEVLKTEIRRLHQHLNKILEASLLEKQEFDLSLETIDCVPLIQDLVSASRMRVEDVGGSIITKGCHKSSYLHVDPLHFSNIIYNLLDNAIKYGGKPPRIEVELIMGEKLEIVISDNGSGIANKYRRRIFSKLYRISKQVGPIEGAGLGLYYAQKMTKWMNGSIKCSSNEGKGSRFMIQFPTNENVS